MKIVSVCLALFFVNATQVCSQHSCLHENMLLRHTLDGDDIEQTLRYNAEFIQEFIAKEQYKNTQAPSQSYIIPVVLHVFHDGDDGKVTREQLESGLEVLNTDIKGLNEDFKDVDPAFENIKSSLDISFCLAQLDPEGRPTTGINYYDTKEGMLNQIELRDYAWDNYKYLNIYLPKYNNGEPSDFTAYAYYPSIFNSDNDLDGIIYSSIRWGYGSHSELMEGQDWASVITHEVGHWLDLRHTFQNGCNGRGDFVDDTPPTEGGKIELKGCDNNDFSCGEKVNGENYMDYNHDCKRMFTQGQVDRMHAALYHPARIELWSQENLKDTGCLPISSANEVTWMTEVKIYPNPFDDHILIEGIEKETYISIYSIKGQLVKKYESIAAGEKLRIELGSSALYYIRIVSEDGMEVLKLVPTKS